MPVTLRHQLTDRAIRAAKPSNAVIKLRDGGGLYLEIKPGGGRFWRHQFRVSGRERLVSLGQYPEISLARARELAAGQREAAARGVDIVQERRTVRAEQRADEERRQADRANTFRAWSEKYREARGKDWSGTHVRDVDRIMGELCDGFVDAKGKRLSGGFGKVQMRELDKSDIVAVINGALARGARVHAADLLTYTMAVVRFFNGHQPRGQKVVLEDLDAEGIRAAMGQAPAAKPHARLPLHEMPAFVRRLMFDAAAKLRVRRAARLLLLTGVRTIELRSMEVGQLDLGNATWTVPASRMKYRRRVWADYHVPLSRQACELLHDVLAERDSLPADDPRRITALMFPNERDPGQMMSENTVLALIKRMGYAGRQTGHGFRGLISTWANREGFNADAIERQLSHVERDRVRGAYNEWEFWPERQKLMQAWADQLDAWLAEGLR